MKKILLTMILGLVLVSKLFNATVRVKTIRPVMSMVFNFTCKQLQIFRSIILFILNRTKRVFRAFVMDNFFRFKKSAYHFFHNQISSFNISVFICSWMKRTIQKYIFIYNLFAFNTYSFSSFVSKFSFFGKLNFYSFVPRNTTFFKSGFWNKSSIFSFVPRSKTFLKMGSTSIITNTFYAFFPILSSK